MTSKKWFSTAEIIKGWRAPNQVSHIGSSKRLWLSAEAARQLADDLEKGCFCFSEDNDLCESCLRDLNTGNEDFTDKHPNCVCGICNAIKVLRGE